MIKSGATFRIIKDHIGSVRLVVDATSGAIAQRIDYDEFGRVLADTSPGFQPFGFAGGLYDADTGLVRFGARDYDAEIGRFTSKDPAGMSSGQTNFYAYAGNDPVNLIDPIGEEPALARAKLNPEATGTSADDPTTQTSTLGNLGTATRSNLDVTLTNRAPSVPGLRRETVKEISQNREAQADSSAELSVEAPDPTVIPKGDGKKKPKIDCPTATATSNSTKGKVTKGSAPSTGPGSPRLGRANRKATTTTQPF